MVSLWCVIVHVASDAPVGRTTVCMFDIRAAAACLFWVVERWASQQRWFQLLCCHWSMVWNHSTLKGLWYSHPAPVNHSLALVL